MSLEWDWETRGVINLKERGAHIYAMDPRTDALLASFKLPEAHGAPGAAWIAAGGPVGVVCRWARGEPCPPYVRAYVEAGGEIKAHNAQFERLIWWHVMAARYGWPKPRIEQFRCTAVTASAMSLPRDLHRLGDALALKVKKDRKGKKLIDTHSVPQGYTPDGQPIWNDDPAGLAEFHDYCDTDVLTEEEADKRLVPLSDDEQRIYALNEIINDRGARIDVRSARAAIDLAERAKERISAELREVTGGRVHAVTEVAKLKAWIESRGVTVDSLDKDTIDELLVEIEDLPADVHRALELRQEGGKTSVEKISAMLSRTGPDGRARGVYLHHGAGQTGRFSSRGLQAHNMPKYRKVFETEKPNLETLFRTIRTGDPDLMQFMYGPDLGRPLHLLSDAVRSFIWAAPGYDLLDADYSSIEGRMAVWFAREEWKLEAFQALDRGEGHGIYELAAAGIYGIDISEVTKTHRTTGKVAELSCQFQTGAGGIRKFARQNKVKLYTLYPALWETADLETRAYMEKRVAERTAQHDQNLEALGREGWIAAELIKTGWRKQHPAISDKDDGAWTQLEEAATSAVENPGTIATALFGRVSYTVRHGFLWCRLPSGRCLAYGRPKMQQTEAPWADKTLEPSKREKKMSLTVRGVDSQTDKWVRFPVYGGSLFNNVVQGSAADVLRIGMQNAEAAGYPVVLHTHDEIAAEVPHGWGDVGEFERLICALPGWADGLPLTASGWRGKRYRKD